VVSAAPTDAVDLAFARTTPARRSARGADFTGSIAAKIFPSLAEERRAIASTARRSSIDPTIAAAAFGLIDSKVSTSLPTFSSLFASPRFWAVLISSRSVSSFLISSSSARSFAAISSSRRFISDSRFARSFRRSWKSATDASSVRHPPFFATGFSAGAASAGAVSSFTSAPSWTSAASSAKVSGASLVKVVTKRLPAPIKATRRKIARKSRLNLFFIMRFHSSQNRRPCADGKRRFLPTLFVRVYEERF
jgi:hypothetical protein